MEFHAKVENGYTIISLSGRLDSVSAPEFDHKFRELLVDNLRVVADLAGLDYISSAGLRSILLMGRLVKEKDGRTCLARVKPQVRTIFDISGLDRVLDSKDTIEEAVAAVLNAQTTTGTEEI